MLYGHVVTYIQQYQIFYLVLSHFSSDFGPKLKIGNFLVCESTLHIQMNKYFIFSPKQ